MPKQPAFEVYERDDGRFGWRLTASNGNIVATDGGQGYENRGDCEEVGRKVCTGAMLGSTVVGERGPEIIGDPDVDSGRVVVEAIQAYERVNGTGWRS